MQNLSQLAEFFLLGLCGLVFFGAIADTMKIAMLAVRPVGNISVTHLCYRCLLAGDGEAHPEIWKRDGYAPAPSQGTVQHCNCPCVLLSTPRESGNSFMV